MEPWFDEKEADALLAYMKSGGWVTEFEKTREFERAIAGYTGAKYCSVVNNGTVSLVLALIACGVGPGDEVVVPDYTMVASANAVKLAGAEVVFADVEPETFCLDFGCLKLATTKHTKAVVLVSINGRYPKTLEQTLAFCREQGIEVIEDAAQSLGSFHNGKHAGTLGDVGCFSFSSPKIISTGQGGAVVTNNESVYQRILKLRDFGREKPGADHYLTMGWNFKFTDIQAVIGIEQMKKLPWRVEKKKKIYAQYQKFLQGVRGVSFLETDLQEVSPWFIDPLVEKREELMVFLKKEGVGSRPFYPALHAEPVYGRSGSFSVTEMIASRGLWLPSSSKLSDEEISDVCKAVKQFYGE